MVIQIGNVVPRGVRDTRGEGEPEVGHTHTNTARAQSHTHIHGRVSRVANPAGDGLSGLIGVLTKMRW